MVTVFDVPPTKLIENIAEKLKEMNIEEPIWVSFVKTGTHKERQPDNDDWWYIRCAALLRKVYTNGPVGIESLRSAYGGRKNKGHKPEKFVKGSGSVLRTALKALEKAELITKTPEGRAIAPKGQSLADNAAKEVMDNMVKENPALSKY
ncbi:30S ribosomal protein S19e [Methanococcus aeolicus]|uniref:30S ribosomal protein S19e n=1 Tax=Methanococcus aeolicus TaxID=42879 RepID=UPI0021C88C0B|nr:30S ribosomal protein S19e [Methanococcus aeolicus]UXM84583.1 30S ribosomal protein S19e [Methanococcus aeolicus]